jgi:hypothetical protein
MARLVALTGRAPGVISRRLCTPAGAIDLAAVAAAADQHLSAATRTHEQPGWRFHRRRPARTWTASAMLGIMPRHACSARCGARRRSGLGGLGRRRACQSAGCHRASLRPMHAVMLRGARTPVDMWTTQERCPHIHRPNNQQQAFNLIVSEGPGSDPACHIQPTVSPGSDDAPIVTRTIFLRFGTAIHSPCRSLVSLGF